MRKTADELTEKLREANDEIVMRGVIIAKLCDALILAVQTMEQGGTLSTRICANGPTVAVVISDALVAAQNRKS